MSELEITYSQSEQVNELVSALAKAKLKYGEVVKSKENKYTGSLYADLQDLMNAAERPLAEEGLVIVHFPLERTEQKKAGALTKLIHTSGQFFGNQFLMPATGKATGGAEKLDAQTITGGVTYAKRCNYGALAGLVGETDDDGNALADKSSQTADVAKPKTVKAPPISQKVSSQGGERPKDTPNKPVEVPAAQQSASQTNDLAPVEQSVVPKAVIPSPEPTPTPAESTSSQSEQLAHGEKPTKTQFDQFTGRVTILRPALEKVGLKPSKNLTVGGKLKNYLLSTVGVKDLTELSIVQWNTFLQDFEPLVQNNPAEAVKLIEGEKS